MAGKRNGRKGGNWKDGEGGSVGRMGKKGRRQGREIVGKLNKGGWQRI